MNKVFVNAADIDASPTRIMILRWRGVREELGWAHLGICKREFLPFGGTAGAY